MAQEYGFSSADIASITSARAGLTAGFMQLGKHIQEDIQRIATIREMKSFGQELAQIDPNDAAFPQKLIGTMSKYPLAIQTPLARQGIEVLGARYKAGIEAKTEAAKLVPYTIGDVTFDPRSRTEFRVKDGVTEFVDTTPQDLGPVRGTMVQTPDNQLLINPRTGETIQTFAPKPQSTRSTNLNVLPENVKMQIKFMDEDAKAVQLERQKLVDAITKGDISTKDRPAAIERQKQLETQLQNIKDTRDKILRESAAQQSEQAGLPSGSGQGNNGPSLMPEPAQNPFVPMALPTNISAPQMVLNTPDSSVLPDNMPVLPGVVPPPKQAGTPRAYQIQNGKFRVLGGNPKAAVEQAYADQVINEEQRTRYLSSLQ
jgi:hypothetical protein